MILEFTHRTLPAHVFTARHAHFERMRAEVLPDDPPYDLCSAWAHFRQRPKRWRFTTWVFWHHGRIAAEANLGFVDLPSNPHLSHPYVSVEPELRRHGIGARLLALAVAGAVRERRQLLITSTTDRVPAGRRFAERYGFRRGIETHLNQLALTGLDRGLMAHWITEASERAADYVVEIWDGLIPESDIVGFADLATVMNSAPRGRLTIDDMKVTPEMIRDSERWLFADGSRRLTAVARHPQSGELVGFTSLSWAPKRAALVWQGDTGVRPDHRNKGLGRWLKAANARALLEANPKARFLRTGNADVNAPMLAINRQMGFRPLLASVGWHANALAVAAHLRRARRRLTYCRGGPW